MKEKKIFMNTQIREIERKYRNEIKYIFEELAKEQDPDSNRKYSGDFHTELSEYFDISGYRGYDSYVNLMDRISAQDPYIAEDLENFLAKEIDLLALLCLSVCIEKLPSLH